MNKKAINLFMSNVIYIILLVVFFTLLILSLRQQYNGAIVWEEFYAKEIAKTIDLAKPGDEFNLDVQKATEIAQKNGVARLGGVFVFDNQKQEVCVKLSGGRGSCYVYFNNVILIDYRIKFGISQSGGNVLHFNVTERRT